MHPNVQYSTIYNRQDMEATEMSTYRWMDKEDVVHKYNGILLIHRKKEWNIAICHNTDGPREYHTKWCRTKRDIIWYH